MTSELSTKTFPVLREDVSVQVESGSRRQRWALTKPAFDKVLRCLDPDPEIAAEKYLVLRRNLVRFFEARGCYFSEDYADETINRLAKRLVEGEEVREISSYCYGVARFLLLELHKEQEREEKAFREQPLHIVNAEPDHLEEHARRHECLNSCLAKLPAESRDLILQYYCGDKRSKIDNRKKMAGELGIPQRALRSRAVRIREKLETCMSRCLKRC